MKIILSILLTLFTLTASAQRIHWFEVSDFDGDGSIIYTGERKYLKKYPVNGGPYITDSTLQQDCNDSNATIYPGNIETCNGIDNDCDGVIDNGITKFKLYVDQDLNGWADDTSSYIYSCTATLPGYADKTQVLRPIVTDLWYVGIIDWNFKQLSPFIGRDILNDEVFQDAFFSMGFRGLQSPWGASTSNEGEVIADTSIYLLPGENYNCTNPNFSYGICKKKSGKDFIYESLEFSRRYKLPIDFIVPIMRGTAKDQLQRVRNFIGDDLINRICLGMETNLDVYNYSDADYIADVNDFKISFPTLINKFCLDAAPADNWRRNNAVASLGCFDARDYTEIAELTSARFSVTDWIYNLKLVEEGITVTLPAQLKGRLKTIPGNTIYAGQYDMGRLTELDGRIIAALGYGLFHVTFNEFNAAHGDSLSGASLQGLKAELITDRNALTLEGETAVIIGKFYQGLPMSVPSSAQSGLFVTSETRDGVYYSLIVNTSGNRFVNPAITVNGATRSAVSFSCIAGVSPDSKLYTIENGVGLNVAPYSVTFVTWSSSLLLTGN